MGNSNRKSVGARVINDAAHLDRRRNRDSRPAGSSESSDIRGAVRHCIRCPIGGGIPVAVGRVCVPRRAGGLGGVKIKSNEWEQTRKGGTAETRLNLHAIVYLACSADVKPCRRERGVRAADLMYFRSRMCCLKADSHRSLCWSNRLS